MSHELQHSFVGDTVKSTQGSIRETMRPKAVQIRMNNLAVNGITDLVNLVDKKGRKDLWKLIGGVGRRQWGGCNLAK